MCMCVCVLSLLCVYDWSHNCVCCCIITPQVGLWMCLAFGLEVAGVQVSKTCAALTLIHVMCECMEVRVWGGASSMPVCVCVCLPVFVKGEGTGGGSNL